MSCVTDRTDKTGTHRNRWKSLRGDQQTGRTEHTTDRKYQNKTGIKRINLL